MQARLADGREASWYERYGTTALMAALALVAAVSIGRVVGKAGSYGMDLQAYWYPGHFIWEHREPYRAYLEKQQPHTPVRVGSRRPSSSCASCTRSP